MDSILNLKIKEFKKGERYDCIYTYEDDHYILGFDNSKDKYEDYVSSVFEQQGDFSRHFSKAEKDFAAVTEYAYFSKNVTSGLQETIESCGIEHIISSYSEFILKNMNRILEPDFGNPDFQLTLGFDTSESVCFESGYTEWETDLVGVVDWSEIDKCVK